MKGIVAPNRKCEKKMLANMEERKRLVRGKEKKVKIFGMGILVTAFIAAIVIFLMMIEMQKRMLMPLEKTSVLFVIKDLPKGTLITEDNVNEYFGKKDMDASLVPRSGLQSEKELLSQVSLVGLQAGNLATKDLFETLDEARGQMEFPVIVGIKADDLSQLVGGMIRVGDRLDLFCIDEEGNPQLVWEDVYVQQVFDQSGVIIRNDDRESSAQRINLYLEKKDVSLFLERLHKGQLIATKTVE